MFPHFIQDALSGDDYQVVNKPGYSANTYHIIPGRNNGLHIEVAREECNDPIRYNLAIFHQDTPKVPNHGWIVSYLETRADGNLITASGYDLKSHS
jgi:hypothetical protein